LKRTIAIIFLTGLFFSNHTQAQLFVRDSTTSDSTLPKAEFGLKLGANFTAINGNIWEEAFKPGVTGGLYVRMYKKKFGVRAEVLLHTCRFTSGNIKDSAGNTVPAIQDSAGDKGDFRAYYFDIPVLLEYNVIPKLVIQAGGEYSNLISLQNLTAFPGNVKTIFKQGELSAVIGLEAKLPYNISLGGRYIYGLSNINNEAVSNSPGSWKTQSIQFYASYKIK
jgi:Outer membrane protein beta-barrel domain